MLLQRSHQRSILDDIGMIGCILGCIVWIQFNLRLQLIGVVCLRYLCLFPAWDPCFFLRIACADHLQRRRILKRQALGASMGFSMRKLRVFFSKIQHVNSTCEKHVWTIKIKICSKCLKLIPACWNLFCLYVWFMWYNWYGPSIYTDQIEVRKSWHHVILWRVTVRLDSQRNCFLI